MKLLFVHDHPFKVDNDIVYSSGSFPYFLWDNYLCFFDDIIVFGRCSNKPGHKVVLARKDDQKVKFKLTKYYTGIYYFFINLNKIKLELKKETKNVDIVLIRLPSVLGFLAAIVAYRNNKKIIVEQVGNAKEAMSTQGSLLGKIAAPFFEIINKRIVKNADYVSYVTLSKLQKDYPSLAFQTSISDVIIEKVCSFSELDIRRFNSQEIKIGVIGGFDVRYKGQDVVLKALSMLDDTIKNNIEIYFIGKGNSNWLVEAAKKVGLKENIKFIGPKKSGEDVFQFLKTLSLYIQPSLTEGMPRALLEAMSVGCPVLGSKVGGIPDVINEEFLHKPGDFKMLSKQIYQLFQDRDLLENEAKRSLKFVNPFQKDILNEKRKKFYIHILNDLQNT